MSNTCRLSSFIIRQSYQPTLFCIHHRITVINGNNHLCGKREKMNLLTLTFRFNIIISVKGHQHMFWFHCSSVSTGVLVIVTDTMGETITKPEWVGWYEPYAMIHINFAINLYFISKEYCSWKYSLSAMDVNCWLVMDVGRDIKGVGVFLYILLRSLAYNNHYLTYH